MKKYFLLGGAAAFLVIFNLGYVFHEIVMGEFFKTTIGVIQRENYIIPLIAIAFLLYTGFQAYMLPIYYAYSKEHYGWSLTKTAVVFGAIVGFFWDGLQGGIIEVATFKMPMIVFWYDSLYHTGEGVFMSLILSVFFRKFALKGS
jgi:hypothetical protein